MIKIIIVEKLGLVNVWHFQLDQWPKCGVDVECGKTVWQRFIMPLMSAFGDELFYLARRKRRCCEQYITNRHTWRDDGEIEWVENDSRSPNRGGWFVKLPLLSVSLSIYAPSLWPFTWNHWPSLPRCCERHTLTKLLCASMGAIETITVVHTHMHTHTHTHTNTQQLQIPSVSRKLLTERNAPSTCKTRLT